MRSRIRTFLPGALALALGASCGSASPESDPEVFLTTEAAVRGQLANMFVALNHAVTGAAEAIVDVTDDAHVRRRAVLWRLYTLRTYSAAVQQEDYRYAVVDLWTLSVQVEQFFATGDGKDWFGDAQPIAVGTASSIRESLESRVGGIFTPDVFEQARVSIHGFAAEHPLEDLSPRAMQAPTAVVGVGMFEWLWNLPSQPFAGVNETARAIYAVSRSMDKFTHVAGTLPSELQLQIEMTLLDIDRSATVQEAAGAFKKIAETVEALPADVQMRLEKTLDGVAGRLPEIRQLVAEATSALEAARQVAESGESLTANLADAGRAWEPTFRELVRITGEKAPLPRDENGIPIAPPEDEDWNGSPDLINLRGTADGLVKASQELRPTVVELNEILASGNIAENVEAVDTKAKATLDQVTASAVDVADALIWRAGLLILIVLLAALAYRFATTRWLARPRRV